MAGIDDVLERLLMDADFARRLAQDPATALAGYELTQDDVTLLQTQVSFDPGALSLVEERVSKAGMFGLLSTFTAGLGGAAQAVGDLVDPGDMPGLIDPAEDVTGVVAPIDSQGIVDPGDMGDPGAQGGSGGAGGEVSFKEVDPAPQPGAEALGTGGGGGGGEVSFKEVDPAPQPGAEALGTGGGGGEVSIKEVDPAPQPGAEALGTGGGLPNPGDTQGFNPQPDPPGAPVGVDGSVSPNIVVQGG